MQKQKEHRTPYSFPNWLHNKRIIIYSLLAPILIFPGAGVVYGFLRKEFNTNMIVEFFNQLPFNITLSIMFAVQAIIIIILLSIIPPLPSLNTDVERWISDRQDRDYNRARQVSQTFRNQWRYVWVSWGLLYLTMSVLAFLAWRFKKDFTELFAIYSPLINFINNLTTLSMIICYRELAFPTKVGDEDNQQDSYWSWVICLLILLFAELVSSSWSTLNFLTPVYGWIGGFGQGVMIAFLIGRIESKVIEPPPRTITLLYLYSAIQGTFALFSKIPEFVLVITSLAFLLKVLLWLVIAWLLESGIMILYMAEVRWLYRTVGVDRNNLVALFDQPQEYVQHRGIQQSDL